MVDMLVATALAMAFAIIGYGLGRATGVVRYTLAQEKIRRLEKELGHD